MFLTFTECHLLPVAGDVSLYKNTLANDLIMPCAVGTIFDNCVCDRDPNYAVDSLGKFPFLNATLL